MYVKHTDSGVFLHQCTQNQVRTAKDVLTLKREESNLVLYMDHSIGGFICLQVPRYYAMQLDLNHVDERSDVIAIQYPETSIQLRPQQVTLYEDIKKEMTENRLPSCIIEAPTGTGKTILAIFLMCTHAKGKTLILVPRRELKRQWEVEIQKFCPNIKIGSIVGNSEHQKGDVYIVVMRTLALTEQTLPFFDTVFIDEVHNIATDTLTKGLMRLHPYTLIGLSATPERRDGMHKVYQFFFSPHVFKLKAPSKQSTQVYLCRYNAKQIQPLPSSAKAAYSILLNILVKDEQRTKYLCDCLSRIMDLLNLDGTKEPRILLVSDRLSMLHQIHKTFAHNSALVVGGKGYDATRCAIPILLGTYQVVSEGFNIPSLQVLVLGTPRSNVKQTVGRIYRQKHKARPIIIDLIDMSYGITRSMARKRENVYRTECVKLKIDNLILD